jgi:hypothetical protein
MGRLGEETESGQLVLTLLLRLIVTRRRRKVAAIGVVVEVAEGGEDEGALLGLGLLEVLLHERLLIEFSLGLVLVGGVRMLVLALAGVVLVRGVLVLLRAMSDEVVGVSTNIATLLWTTIMPAVHAVVVKP